MEEMIRALKSIRDDIDRIISDMRRYDGDILLSYPVLKLGLRDVKGRIERTLRENEETLERYYRESLSEDE